jgi:hypothetical protein
MFFNRTLDSIHVIAVSIWHCGNNLVGTGSRVAKRHIRNQVTTSPTLNWRIAHSPKFNDLLSLSGHCDYSKEKY